MGQASTHNRHELDLVINTFFMMMIKVQCWDVTYGRNFFSKVRMDILGDNSVVAGKNV